MSRRIIILLIVAILILSTVMAMEPSVSTKKADEEVTVTDLNKNINSNEEEAKTKAGNVNINEKQTKVAEEAAAPTREVVNRKKKSGDENYLDLWFNRPKSRFNRLFKSLFSDEEDDDEDHDLFGNVFKDFFGDLSPFGSRRGGRRGSSLFGRNRKPLSLLSSIFDEDDEDTGSNKLWEGSNRWPILREPSNLLSSFSKMFQDFKRREKDEWKENPEAYELRVKLPEGMKKENVNIEIEKDEDESGRHTLLIHGKAEKHEEVKKEAPKESAPQIKDSDKQETAEGQAETKKTDVVATPENKEVSATPTRFDFYKKVDQVSELERRYVIPATVDTDKVSAEIQDGNILVITMGKKAEAIKRKQKVAVNIQ